MFFFLFRGVFNHRDKLIAEHEELSKLYAEFDDVYQELTEKVSKILFCKMTYGII